VDSFNFLRFSINKAFIPAFIHHLRSAHKWIHPEAAGFASYVSDGIATFTKALHVRGVRQTDIYYEEVFSAVVARPAYNVWVKVEMSKVDFMHAKAEALKALQGKFDQDGDVEAKEKAQELLDSLKRDYL